MRIKRILGAALAAIAPATGDVPEDDGKTAEDRSKVSSKKNDSDANAKKKDKGGKS